MIFDCFQFFNELDLLGLRLNILDPVVDKFVISESLLTHSGKPKPLYYDENKNLFKKFEHKIIHNIVTDTPDGTAFERDSFEKCAVKRALKNCIRDDVILFSDLDEIPNPEKIREILNNFDYSKIYHFAQRNFYCYLNLEEISGKLLSFSGEFEGVEDKKWLGTKMCKYSFMENLTTEQLRFPEQKTNGIRVRNGGWHFTYMGGDSNMTMEERVSEKLKAFSHQEYNTSQVLSTIKKKITSKKDLFGRDAEFKRVEIDDSYPAYLLDHLSEFEHLILAKNATSKLLSFFQKGNR